MKTVSQEKNAVIAKQTKEKDKRLVVIHDPHLFRARFKINEKYPNILTTIGNIG